VSPQNYENEKKKIFEIGRVNGYPGNTRRNQKNKGKGNESQFCFILASSTLAKFSSEMIFRWYVKLGI
jgi:hypothetical protein